MKSGVARDMRKWGLTNEESAGKGPLLGATDDGERQPMGGNEGMQKRNRRNSSDGGQIFGAETFHYPHAKRREYFVVLSFAIYLQRTPTYIDHINLAFFFSLQRLDRFFFYN